MKPLTLRHAGVLPIVLAVLVVGATIDAVPAYGVESLNGPVVRNLLAESSVDATEIEELIAVDSTTGEIVPYVQYFAEDAVLPEFVPFGSSRTQPGIDVLWGGYLGGPTGADLLLYDRDSGWFEFRSVGEDGQTAPFFSAFGTRGWSHVVPGDYNGDGIADLLFYRASDGLMRFYTITADGTFRAMTPVMYGNRGWTQMVPGDFDNNGTDDLMWYRASDGLMRFYTVSSTGRFAPMTPVMYGNRGWDRIPSGDFDGDATDDLMYYRSTDGLYRFYTIGPTGRFAPISDVGYTRTGWHQILAGQFGAGQGADLVFYQPGTLQASEYSKTTLVPITSATSMRPNLVFAVLNWRETTPVPPVPEPEPPDPPIPPPPPPPAPPPPPPPDVGDDCTDPPNLVPYADLHNCDLRGVDLGNLDLTGANLAGADLRGARLSHGVFSWANMAGANLSAPASEDAYSWCLSQMGMECWTNVTFTGTNLNGAKMSNIEWYYGGFTGATLIGADMRNTDFNRSGASGSDFTGADLSNSGGYMAGIDNCIMYGANLTGWGSDDWTFNNNDLSGADFSNSSFSFTAFTNSNLMGSKWTGVTFDEGIGWTGATCPDGSPSSWDDGDGFTCRHNLNQCGAPPSGAVASWRFDDLVTPTRDPVGGHDADLFEASFTTNGIAPTCDNVGALRFNGYDGYASIPDPDGAHNLDGFSAITISAWIKPDFEWHGGIVLKYDSSQEGAAGVSWGLAMQGDDLQFAYSWDEYTAPGVITIGEWQHVAGTWDGTDIRLYRDGVEVAHGANVFTTMPDNQVPVNIGAAEGNVQGQRIAFFNGRIDDVYIFDRALNASEIAVLAGG